MRKRYDSQSLDLTDGVADVLSEAMASLDHEHSKARTRVDPDIVDFAMVMTVMVVGILAVSVLA